MEDFDFFQRTIQGVKILGTDRLFLVDFEEMSYQEPFEKKFGNYEIAGLYLLINLKTNEIYVGESTDIIKRNKGEIKNGFTDEKKKDFKFDKIILIWDGRPTITSLFGDDAFRKLLEKYCIKLFKEHERYKCLNITENPRPTNLQTQIKSESFEKHILFLLKMHGLM